MGRSPITQACRAFLRSNGVCPIAVSLHLEARKTANGDYDRRRVLLQSPRWWSGPQFIRPDGRANTASLERHPRSGNILLKVGRPGRWYRERGDGTADLVLFGTSLPETVCLGLKRDTHRLSEIASLDGHPFYSSGDPLVRRMRNGARGGRKALILVMIPTWEDFNWDFEKGVGGSSE